MDNLNILSMNCNGLADNLKRKDIFDVLRKLNYNLYFLQETHLQEGDENFVRSGWGFDVITAGKSSNSGGTAILINNNFQYTITRTIREPNGQYILLDIDFMDKKFTLINLYGPSYGDNELFFTDIDNLLQSSDERSVIIGGDFNCVLDLNKDRKNCTTNNRPKSRAKILEIMASHNLIDIFRSRNPDKEIFTWRRFNTNKQARLDFFLISEDLINETIDTKVERKYRSDHNPITLTLLNNSFKRDKTNWKFNNSLLYDKDYITQVKNTIEITIKQYCNLAYNMEKIKDIPIEEINFRIEEDLFLETLLMEIRGKTIAYSSFKKKQENRREKELEEKINDIENNLTSNFDELNTLKTELETLREKKIQGMAIRSKANWANQGEKVNKYFCNLENRNFQDKLIPILEVDNGNIISNQEQIKQEIRMFYEKLYSAKEVTDCSFEEIRNIGKTLTDNDKHMLENPLTVEEIKIATKHLSQNKSPGPDGFTSEFFKFFIDDLGPLIVKSANLGFEKGELSPTFRQGTIVLIPKENKPKRFVKNLRPISLLSTVYKIVSTSLSNRMKMVLPGIIGETQNAFIKSRNINSNIRFIYDTLVYTEENHIPGMLLSIDFEKAFDSISWNFLFKALNFFNFGVKFINYIKTLYFNIQSNISVNGQYSEWFSIGRGVRQGDPSSPYLYLICAEVMSLMITNNKEIKGIKMKDKTNLLSQFADDTTLSLDGTEKSLTEALNTITQFSRYSGLRINESKTMIIWIGSRKGSNVRYLRDKNYVWDPGTSFKIVGIKFSTNIRSITNLNFDDKLNEIRRTLSKWKKRQITPIGKIAILKTLIMSKITHLLINIPDPPENFINEMEKEFFRFLWSNKPSKISKTTVIKEYNEGGLRMINIRNFISALKSSWIRKMHYNKDITNMITDLYPELPSLPRFGVEFSKKLHSTIKNPFWKDVVKHFIKIQEHLKPSDMNELMSDHIFYNSNILRNHQPIFLKEWADNDIIYIHQLHNDEGRFLSFDEFRTKYNNLQTNFLVYQGTINAIRRYKNTIQIPNNFDFKLTENKVWHNFKKGNKHVQKILNTNKTLPAAVIKWNLTFVNLNWVNIFNMIYTTSNDVQYRWFQYRLIHRILPTQHYLYLTKITDSPICNLCQEDEQDISHLFFECNVSQMFWGQFESWLKENCQHCHNIRILKQFVLFGTLENFKSDKVFDFLILFGKHYIYKCKLNDDFPTLEHFKILLKKRFNMEQYIAVLNNSEPKFKTNWLLYKHLIST